MLQGWMVKELGLSGGLLSTYALVHQFSQSRAGVYLGGPGYVSAWLGCSVNTARTYLHTLTEKGLLEVEDQVINGVLFRNYRVAEYPLQKFEAPSKNNDTPLQNLEVEDNKNISSKDDNNISIKKGKFDFRKALIELGVTPEVADAWLLVRKAKKAVNTEIAFKAISNQIARTEKIGKTADECIRVAVEKSWCGFNADWLDDFPSKGTPSRRADTPVRRNTTEDLLALGAEMFGHQPPVYDEQ